MQYIEFPAPNTWQQVLKRPVQDLSEIEGRVAPILKAVKEEGDKALFHYTRLFDKTELSDIQVSEAEMKEAEDLVSPALKEALQVAYANISNFHVIQKEEPHVVETMPGVSCWRKSVPISKVGLYIPGGTAPLCSTVLMLGIPAQLAGCSEIVMCTPTGKDGKIHPAILYAASLVGVTQIFKVGGAQAVAAMAYGTESVPQVYKIFGPGNQYVTIAKQLINKEGVAIDMPAGPSEVLVYADDTAVPAFVAADLLSQAEHGIDSQVVLVTASNTMYQKVQQEVEKQVALLPRAEIAREALTHSKAILVRNEQEALDLINAYAPEHLILAIDEFEDFAENVINAGSVFLGHYTPESAGDYASGTNHTLPTNGFARAYSGVSLDSFFKKITFQRITPEGLKQVGPSVELMAEAEELQAHKNAVTLRLEVLKAQR
jgi:histidinol dehydrogenase